jgi:hypothetical protein
MIRYEYGDMRFEFERDGAPTHGTVKVTAFDGEQERTYVGKVDLISPQSRSAYHKQARELYEDAFADELSLPRALNELGVHVDDGERIRKAKEAEAALDDENVNDGVEDEKVEELLSTLGVLNRYVEEMARINKVHGDRDVMKMVTLSALSAQLEQPAPKKPVGSSMLLMGDSSRGKNFVVDAVADGMPESFKYEFESASSKSFYYEAAAKPQRFEHTWLYANEAEAVDELIEVLRPLLSKGSALHKSVDKIHDSNTFREFKIQGPITATIPTVRNVMDKQFMSRLLVTELEDFEGRIAAHTGNYAQTLLPQYVAQDQSSELDLWKAALEKLTKVRRVVIPSAPPGFCFSNEEVSHGSRLWKSFMTLVLSNCWLEQRNREVRTLPNDLEVVVATAEDYTLAYEIFSTTAGRSIVNIGDNHRAMLNALYELETSEAQKISREKGFSLRAIAKQAGVSHQTVSNNRAFLCGTTVGCVKEMERGGLRLVEGADPGWWAKPEDLLKGFPTPKQVSLWWGSSDRVDRVDTDEKSGEFRIPVASEVSTEGVDKQVDMSTQVSTPPIDRVDATDKPNIRDFEPMSSVSTPSENTKKKRKKIDYDYIPEDE